MSHVVRTAVGVEDLEKVLDADDVQGYKVVAVTAISVGITDNPDIQDLYIHYTVIFEA